jgi:hypothetical protein
MTIAFLFSMLPAPLMAARDDRIEGMKAVINQAIMSCGSLDVDKINDLKIKFGANLVGGVFTIAGGTVAAVGSIVAIASGSGKEVYTNEALTGGSTTCIASLGTNCTNENGGCDAICKSTTGQTCQCSVEKGNSSCLATCPAPELDDRSKATDVHVKGVFGGEKSADSTTARNARIVSTIGSGVATVAAGASALAYIEIIDMMGDIDGAQTDCYYDVEMLWELAKSMKRPETGINDGTVAGICGTDAATINTGRCACVAGTYKTPEYSAGLFRSAADRDRAKNDSDYKSNQVFAWCAAPNATSLACGSYYKLAHLYWDEGEINNVNNSIKDVKDNGYTPRDSVQPLAVCAATADCPEPSARQSNGSCKCPGPDSAYEDFTYAKEYGSNYYIADRFSRLMKAAGGGGGKCYGDCGDEYTMAELDDGDTRPMGECVRIANYDPAVGCGEVAWVQQEYRSDGTGTGQYKCTCPGDSKFINGKCVATSLVGCNCTTGMENYAECVANTQNVGYNKNTPIAENLIYILSGGYCVYNNKSCGILKVDSMGNCVGTERPNMQQKKGVYICIKASVQRTNLATGENYCISKTLYKQCKKKSSAPNTAGMVWDVDWRGECVQVGVDRNSCDAGSTATNRHYWNGAATPPACEVCPTGNTYTAPAGSSGATCV